MTPLLQTNPALQATPALQTTPALAPARGAELDATARLGSDGRIRPYTIERRDRASGSTHRWSVELGLGFAPAAVARHWLANCHGFHVDTGTGAPLGVVDDVRLDEQAEPAALEVARRAFGRSRLVAVGSVVAIVPLERRLVVAPEGDHEPPAARRIAA
jgi:hypothetical protein